MNLFYFATYMSSLKIVYWPSLGSSPMKQGFQTFLLWHGKSFGFLNPKLRLNEFPT
jgi:hypothetical protein